MEILDLSLAEEAERTEDKKPRTDDNSVKDDSAKINMVYALLMSFKAEVSEEDTRGQSSNEDLPVA